MIMLSHILASIFIDETSRHKCAAFLKQGRAGRAMDGAVHTAAPQQHAVGCVHNGIDAQAGDVPLHDLNRLQTAAHNVHYSRPDDRFRAGKSTRENENERLIAEVKALQDREEQLLPEERRLLNLLLLLIEDYEERKYRLKAATPDEVLRELMRARGIRQKDLLEVFGSKGIASEVVRGRRAVSRTQAKRLARFFHVSAALFL
jgi:HTH-type transcriptional regulator/antitoxin HigA